MVDNQATVICIEWFYNFKVWEGYRRIWHMHVCLNMHMSSIVANKYIYVSLCRNLYLQFSAYPLDPDDCYSYPCANGAFCQDGIGYFTCVCAVGYTGTFCQTSEWLDYV